MIKTTKNVTYSCTSQGQVPQKMVKFNPGLSQFQVRYTQLEVTNINTVEPLLRDIVMITQNVTLSNALECKIQKRNIILILD